MFLKHLAILCILSACCWAQEGIPCYNGTGSSILIQHPRCRRSGPAIYQENCPTVSKADSDFEVVDLQETNVCQLRLYFQNSLQGCRCVVDRDDDCPVYIRKPIKSMDIIGHCTWKIFGKRRGDRAIVGPHEGNNHTRAYHYYSKFGLRGQYLRRAKLNRAPTSEP